MYEVLSVYFLLCMELKFWLLKHRKAFSEQYRTSKKQLFKRFCLSESLLKGISKTLLCEMFKNSSKSSKENFKYKDSAAYVNYLGNSQWVKSLFNM